MNQDSEREKIDALAKKIHQAEAKPEPQSGGSSPAQGNRLAAEFIGAILGSVFLGWGMDRFFSTAPWCLLGMLIVGFAVGMWNMWRATQGTGPEDESGK